MVVHALALGGVLISGSLMPGYGILEMLVVKQRDFIGMATDVASGSLLAMPPLEPGLLSFLRAAPHALYMTFLSPFVVTGTGPLAVMSAAENVLLLMIPLIALRCMPGRGARSITPRSSSSSPSCCYSRC